MAKLSQAALAAIAAHTGPVTVCRPGKARAPATSPGKGRPQASAGPVPSASTVATITQQQAQARQALQAKQRAARRAAKH